MQEHAVGLGSDNGIYGVDRVGKVEIAMVEYIAVGIGQKHRYGMVAAYD